MERILHIMNEIILLKLGEMVLKGLNRRSFEDKLQANLHRRLRPFGQFRVYTRQSATYVEPIREGCDVEGAYEALKHVFGIVGLSLARPCGKDKDAILACAKEFLDDQLRAARTFKVETKRADKTFPMTSIQLSQYVGGELDEKYPNLTVDVHHPELTVYLEVRDYAAYVHADPEPGAGGLPVGVGGRAVSLLSGGIDSPVASWKWCTSSPTPTPPRRPSRRCSPWPSCSPPGADGSPSTWCPSPPSRRSCAAPAPRRCSPWSCADS